MSKLSDLNEFYKYYDTPKVEKVIVGFSGIDPMPKGMTPNVESMSGGTSYSGASSEESIKIIDNEQLNSLIDTHIQEYMRNIDGGEVKH